MVKLLLVEDNEDNRDAISRRLIRRGYGVALACDGAEGLQAAQNSLPDLILLDMNLPEIDGWEVARRLKASVKTQGIPIIALTAHAMLGDREKALGAGCDDYHTKPIELAALIVQIEALLQKAGAR
ncbi:response regulator [Massilia sp. H6]|uniref:response regulator n=1 Tax=Massilia sp. H6 TaxID=2970464 RepID=UPI002169A420|nr:response regulator [Massilia sp. H6]UVW30503.1 response regulator [Massilia sp. H6]